jgi:hypothetical protein
MTPPPIRSMAELLVVIRARRDELNISHETIDNIAGLQAGYTSKMLAEKPIRGVGYMSLGAVLGSLGIGLAVVEDTEQCARVETRWQKRKRPQKLLPALASRFSIENEAPTKIEVTPELQAQLDRKEYMKMIGKRGGHKGGKRRLKTMTARARQRAATHAARIRWSKERRA